MGDPPPTSRWVAPDAQWERQGDLQGELTSALSRAGCVAAQDEAHELLQAAADGCGPLDALVARRMAGEPLSWITGRTDFDGLDVVVHPGVYVPRGQSIELARRAVAALREDGAALDLCTGTGAIALALRRGRPQARVLATDIDARAVACAAANGVEAYLGDLFAPLCDDEGLRSLRFDVVVAVVPYVPSGATELLPRDVPLFEDLAHYDGGADGTDVLVRVVQGAPPFLRPGGMLLVELGGDQARPIGAALGHGGYRRIETWVDEDGDLRGISAVFG